MEWDSWDLWRLDRSVRPCDGLAAGAALQATTTQEPRNPWAKTGCSTNFNQDNQLFPYVTHTILCDLFIFSNIQEKVG